MPKAALIINHMKINIPTKITIARIVLIIAMLIGLFVCYILNLTTGWIAPTLGNSNINLIYFICHFFNCSISVDFI